MPGESLIGNLAILLSMDTAAFEKGSTHAQKLMRKTQRSFEDMGRKIGGVGIGLTAAITAPFIGLVAKAVPAAIESQKAIAQVNAALASMGPTAGKTSKQLEEAAKQLQSISTFDDDDILVKITANMLTFGNVSGKAFDRAQLAAVNLSARLGQDLQSSAIQVGKALNDPIKGLTALARVGVSFTAQQKEQVKELVKTNQLQRAQGIILGELEKQFGGAAKAQRDATPGADTIDAWRNFEETLGQIALRVLPPLTKLLTDLLNKFNTLSPGMQTFAVAAAAVAAGLGPLLIGVGALVSGFGRLLPLIVPLGPAAAGGAAGIAGLTGVLGPLALAAVAVFVAFQNWDKIAPIIEQFRAKAGPAFADLQKQLNSFQKAIDDFDRRMGIPSNQELINSLVTGLGGGLARVHSELLKFNAAMNSLEAAIGRFARNAWTSFEELWNRAVKAFDNMVTGIQNAVGNRLRNVFDGVKKQVAAVGDAFARLYDRVVGRSYVPDMIDGIAREMAKLDAVMTQPAIKATNKTAQAFRTLQEQAASLLNELFPEAAEANAFQAKLALTEKSMKSGIYTATIYKAALDRLYFGQPAGKSDPPDLSETLPLLDPDAAGRGLEWLTQHLEKIPPLAQQANDAFANIAQQGIASLADGLAAVLTGTAKLGDVFRSVAQQIIADLLRIQIQKMLVGLATSIGIPGASSWFGGARAAGGPVASGKLYLVGEKGPELFAPGRSGKVIANDNMGSAMSGAGDLHIHYGYPVSARVARQTAVQADTVRRQRLGTNARRGYSG